MGVFVNLLNKIVQKVKDHKNINRLKKSAYFDAKYYLNKYKDVAQSSMPPEDHYYHFGWREGRNPNHIFKSHDYLDDNQDVKTTGVCPLIHFTEYGKFERRSPARNLDFVEYKDVKVLGCNKETPSTTLKVCALFHLYPENSIINILPYIKNLPAWIDIYIATDTDDKINNIFECLKKNGISNKFEIIQIQNQGRDIGALLIGFNEIVRKYDLFCFAHFKRSPHLSWGDSWRNFIFNNILGCQQGIEELINLFEVDKNLGLVYPPQYPTFLLSDGWDASNNKRGLETLLREKLNYRYDVTVADKFPVGGMFWARTDATLDVFDINFSYEDLTVSSGKLDGERAHLIERIWGIVAQKNGYTTQEILISPKGIATQRYAHKRRIVFLSCKQLDANIQSTCKELLKIAEKVIILTNADVGVGSNFLKTHCTVLLMKNLANNFDAWREGINFVGYEELCHYDELIVCDDSCLFPIFGLENMFADMESVDCDFWSNTLHPPSGRLQEHIQSYFLCFKNSLFMSYTFKNFFHSTGNSSCDLYTEDIRSYEDTLTQNLTRAGFKYKCHICIDTKLFPFSLTQNPLAYLILGNNFIHKRCFENIPGYEDFFIGFVKKMAGVDITDHLFSDVTKVKSDIYKVVPQLTCFPAVKQPLKKIETRPKSIREYFRILLSQAKSVLEIRPFTVHPFNTGKNVKYFDVQAVRKLSEKAKLTKTNAKSPPFGLDFVSQRSDLEIVQEKIVAAFSINFLDSQPDIITHINDVFSLLNNNSSYYLIFSGTNSFHDRFGPLSTLADIFRAFPLKSESCSIEADGGKNKPSIPNDFVRHLAHEHRLPHITRGRQKYGNKAYDESFLYIIKSLYYLGYIDCLPSYYAPTPASSNEFGCILKKTVPQGTSVTYNVSAHFIKSIIYENCTLENGVFISQPGCEPMFHILPQFVKNSSALGINLDINPELQTTLKIYYSTDRFSFSDDQCFSFPLRQGAQTVKINIPLETLPDLFYIRIVPVAGPINFTLS